MKIPTNLPIDDPAFPLLQAGISYMGITTAAGNAAGTTFVCADLANEPSYVGHKVKILTGGAAGQQKVITNHAIVTGTETVLDAYTDNTGAPQQIAAGTLFIIGELGGGSGSVITGPQGMSLYEGWEDLLIDPARWTETDPATGLVWTPAVWPALPASILNMTTPNANETARLAGNFLFYIPTTALGTQFILQKLVLEFEADIITVANIDNTLFFMGFTPAQANTRASNNILGFGLLADALQTITDVGGVEEINTGFGEALAQVNKYRMEISDTQVLFYLNETLLATHVTSLPNVPSYVNFFIDTEAGGAATLAIGNVRAWFDAR